MTNKTMLTYTIAQAITTENINTITLKCIWIDSYGDIECEGKRSYKNTTAATATKIVSEIERSFEMDAAEAIVKIGNIVIDIDICYNYDIIEE